MPIIPKKTKMAEQRPEERITNFKEVALGYSAEQAREEAGRCLFCKKPVCIEGCPVGVEIPQFIQAIKEGDFSLANKILKEKNNLPAICGRVCPQESQCEKFCLMGKKNEPVAIGRLERFAADRSLAQGEKSEQKINFQDEKAAVIGAGPAGLTCAADLARLGYKVTIFESLHEPGGVLNYGIPPFRLPKEVTRAEINYIRSLGVDIVCDAVVGKTYTIDELFAQGYAAVFIGTGAGLPKFMEIPGENLNGVYSANEFLSRVILMQAYLFPETDTPINLGKKVVVIGGGNVAMDCARVSKRLGSQVTIIYRRTEKELPARLEEVHHAQEEKIEFLMLAAPVRFLGDEKNNLTGVECIKMELGEPDASGRRIPSPLKGSEFKLEIDTAIIALGTIPTPLIAKTTPGLKIGKRGTIEANPETGAASLPGIYAGGDVVTGAATVIEAMGAGKRAAKAIDEYIRNKTAGN
ncbi:MAG: NADPH-dependent glutamate synthase [Elusimicrobiota bacterium]